MIQVTPLQFEKIVHAYLKEIGTPLNNFEITHNVKEKTHDGNYQIDITAVFKALNVDIVVLVECKRHKSAIKRDDVSLLHGKINTFGAHKGIIFSTADFQSGAILFAREHGIALIKVSESVGNSTSSSSGTSQVSKFLSFLTVITIVPAIVSVHSDCKFENHEAMIIVPSDGLNLSKFLFEM
jgi:restriction system protein